MEKLTTPDHRKAVEAYKKQAARQSDIEREAVDKEKTGVFTGGYAINPVNGSKHPDLDRGLRADDLRHRRDHGRAGPRRARLRLCPQVWPEDHPGHPAGGHARPGRRHDGSRLCRRRAHDQLGPVQRHEGQRRKRPQESRHHGRDRLAGGAGHWQGSRHLQTARLADLAPALLGRAHPDGLLREGWLEPRAGRPAARAAAGRRGVEAHRRNAR